MANGQAHRCIVYIVYCFYTERCSLASKTLPAVLQHRKHRFWGFFYHLWCVAFQEKKPPVVRTQTLWQPNAKITLYAEAHLRFTLHHQQPGHKAATGNGLWSIAFQQLSLDTLRFYLKPARNWTRMSLCIVEHCIAANLQGRSVRGEPSKRPINCIWQVTYSNMKLKSKQK